MQLTQILTILAVAAVGVVAAPGGGHGPPPPPPPPPSKPTSVVQQVLYFVFTLLCSSNSRFRLLAMETPTHTAALQAKPEEPLAWVSRVLPSTAMVLRLAATTTMV
jgi:hypothetical protein